MSPRSPAIRSAASPNVSAKSTPTEMTANQYKAVMFIKGIIEKKGARSIIPHSFATW
jgi:hypothetical protein